MADDDVQQSGPDELSTAIEAVRDEPQEAERWDRVEELLDTIERPDDVSALFQSVLGGNDGLDAEVIDEVAQRGVRFYETWYGEDSNELPKLLERVLALQPEATWAFERLTVAHTVSERWAQLLDAYDRAIAAVDSGARRMQLLDEAAQAAKDFANEPDRAIGYLLQLYDLAPDNATVASSLERLLERQERWPDLVTLWQSQLERQTSKQAGQTRLRMAELFLDKTDEYDRALEQAKEVLDANAGSKAGLAVLERVLSHQAAEAEVRREAQEILKRHFVETKKPREVVRVLEAGLDCAGDKDRRDALRELVERLVDLNNDPAALQHQASLLILEPTPTERDGLRNLAERTRDYGLFAETLVQAADGCPQASVATELRIEAARTFEDKLSDNARAIELYQGIFTDADAGFAAIEVGRRLIPLLEKTEREQETLEALARMSELEPEEALKRELLGKVARLAERLGNQERAAAAWQARIGSDTEDVEALDALIQTAAEAEDWSQLVQLLEQRIKAPAAAERRRDDLVRLAAVHAERLADLPAAIEVWRRVQSGFGEDTETVAALTELLARAERWEELAETLGQAADRQITRFTDLQTRLGDAFLRRLDRPESAVERYRSALQVDPVNAAAREGLRATVEDERCRGAAIEALSEAYAITGEWENTLALLEPRLQLEESPTVRAELLIEAAELHEDRGEDLQAALACYTRAFALIPDDRSAEKEIRRLAEQLEAWGAVVQAYRDTIESFGQVTPRVGELRYEEGQTLENRLGDAQAALGAYAQAASICRDRVPFALAAARVAAELGHYDDAVAHALGCMVELERPDQALIETLEHAAERGESWEALCQSMLRALGFETETMKPALARQLYARTAGWQKEKRGDDAAAENCLLRAVEADASDGATLRALIDLQRREPSEALVDSLLKLADLHPANLDPLLEAADVARETVADEEARVRIYRRLFDGSARALRSGQETAGEASAAHGASWAVDQLSAVLPALDQADRAVEVLREAASLPFDGELRRDYLCRAAELARGVLGDAQAAIMLYRDVLQIDGADRRALQALGQLYTSSDSLPELLMLRRQELELERDPDRALELRLAIVQLLGEMEARGGRLELLKNNLKLKPGHEETVSAIIAILNGQRRHAELAELLAQQAKALSKAEQTARAAGLLRQAAALYSDELGDTDAAISTYRRLHELEPGGPASAALARLYLERGQHAMAAQWMEVRLDAASDEDRPAAVAELANVQLAAGQREQAYGNLERALSVDPGLDAARETLTALYREDERYKPLARLLVQSADRCESKDTALSLLEEAANLYERVLEDPARAVEPLAKALELAPKRRDLGLRHAEGLRVAGRLDEAQGALEAMVASYGRKRSAERADLHYLLAGVARDAGDLERAYKELETATKMDMAHSRAMHMLGKLSHQQGDLDRAERAYRGLLMLVRRHPPEAEEDVGPSEVFFELSAIATAREQNEQAEELMESAMEAATQSDSEARRFQRVLRTRGETDQLMRLLDARMKFAQDASVEAEILAVRAQALADPLGRHDEALETILKAVSLDPGSDALHQQARKLSASMQQLDAYVERLSQLSEDARRKKAAKSKKLSARLNLRMGEVFEAELNDLDRAAAVYAKVEASGLYVTDAWMAMARVAGKRGDVEEQRRVLQRIADPNTKETSAEQRRDALYALAELELSDADRRDQGVADLERALEGESDFGRAKEVLRATASGAAGHTGVQELFERVARDSGDDLMLLEHFERLAVGEVGLGMLRQGIELAQRMGETGRAEQLLIRAAEVARGLENREGTTWIFSGLAECRSAAGDIQRAIGHLQEAVETAEGSDAEVLGRELAELAAGEGGDLEVAVATYSRLLDADRSDRTLWVPLLSVFRRIGDRGRFEAFAEQCAQDLLGGDERAMVHLARAKFLVEVEGDERDAVVPLRAALDEDPGQLEATEMLTEIYNKYDMGDELAELLGGQFDRARDMGNVEAVVELGLRIGGLYGPDRAEAAVDTYRTALEFAPTHPGLLRALLGRLGEDAPPRDRAEVMQALLKSEQGAEAAELALAAVELWNGLDEHGQVERALELGLAASPDHEGLRSRLEGWYAERGMWRPLAELLESDAARLGATGGAVARLKNAAMLYREQLDDLNAAAGSLRKAIEIVPDDLSLLGELARNLAAAGEHEAAIGDVTGLLDRHPEKDAGRVDLLKVRSELYLAVERLGDAVGDLEEAHAIAAEEVAPALIDALERSKTVAFTAGDTDAERRAAMRLVEVHDGAGALTAAREVLAGWVEQDPRDVEALRALRRRDEDAELWEEVARSCERLLEAETGEARIEAALGLADACDRAGRPERAREGLERIHMDEPSNGLIRGRLRELYAAIDAKPELAAILLTDAYATEEVDEKVSLFQRAARLYLEMDDASAALGPLDEATKLQPEDHESQLLMIDIQIKLGRIGEAKERLDEGIKAHKRRRSPELASLLLRMGHVAAAEGEHEEHLKYLNQALECDRKNGYIASELAEAAIASANYDAAMKALRSITMMDDPKPITRAMAFLKQAQIAHLRGDPRRAQHWARKAKSLDEDLAEADNFLAELGA